jgi:hypothetical protein
MLKGITFQNYLSFSGCCKLPASGNALFMFLIGSSIEYFNNKANCNILQDIMWFKATEGYRLFYMIIEYTGTLQGEKGT